MGRPLAHAPGPAPAAAGGPALHGPTAAAPPTVPAGPAPLRPPQAGSTALLERPTVPARVAPAPGGPVLHLASGRSAPPVDEPAPDAADASDGDAGPSGPDLAHIGTEELMATLEAMPASAPVALRVLDAIDSRISTAATVGGVVEGDPSLTARLLRLANSAYYSPMTAVTTTVRAIGLVGFSAVRALAVTTAAGLNGAEMPTGFWEHSAQTAHAASLLARHFGLKSNEAFSLGLLHDMGEGLMCVADAEAWSHIEAEAPVEGEARLELERQVYGTTHPELGARLLRAWGLPEASRQAIAEHHRSDPGGPSDVIRASEALVTMVVDEDPERREAAEALLREVGVEPYLVRSAARRIESEAASIVEVLRS